MHAGLDAWWHAYVRTHTVIISLLSFFVGVLEPICSSIAEIASTQSEAGQRKKRNDVNVTTAEHVAVS